MLVVLRIGGSVIASPMSTELVDGYADLLKGLKEMGHQVVAVVGGGALAREFIRIGAQLGLGQEEQDQLAIHVSRLYALLFMLKLGGNGIESLCISVGDAVKSLKRGRIVVMGGVAPGMTTDSVAAKIAREAKAQLLVKATDQDGIYDKDPAKHKEAKKLDRITFNGLAELFGQTKHQAGIHQVLDPVAIKILQESTVKTIVVNGFNPQNVLHAIEGKKVGTTVTQ